MIATGAARANGQVERYVATLTSLLAIEIEGGSEWSSSLPKVQLTLNSTVQKSSGFAPLRLLIGVNANIPIVQGVTEFHNEVEEMPHIDINEDRELACQNLQRNSIKQKQEFDRKRRAPPIVNVGDYVVIQQQNPRLGKLAPKFKGPYKVIKVLPNDRFEINSKRKQVVPIDRLKVYKGEFIDSDLSSSENGELNSLYWK